MELSRDCIVCWVEIDFPLTTTGCCLAPLCVNCSKKLTKCPQCRTLFQIETQYAFDTINRALSELTRYDCQKCELVSSTQYSLCCFALVCPDCDVCPRCSQQIANRGHSRLVARLVKQSIFNVETKNVETNWEGTELVSLEDAINGRSLVAKGNSLVVCVPEKKGGGEQLTFSMKMLNGQKLTLFASAGNQVVDVIEACTSDQDINTFRVIHNGQIIAFETQLKDLDQPIGMLHLIKQMRGDVGEFVSVRQDSISAHIQFANTNASRAKLWFGCGYLCMFRELMNTLYVAGLDQPEKQPFSHKQIRRLLGDEAVDDISRKLKRETGFVATHYMLRRSYAQLVPAGIPAHCDSDALAVFRTVIKKAQRGGECSWFVVNSNISLDAASNNQTIHNQFVLHETTPILKGYRDVFYAICR